MARFLRLLHRSSQRPTLQIRIMAKLTAQAAQYTLYEVLYRVLQLLAPVTPHLTEEIYQNMYAEDKGFESLQVSPWPKFNPEHSLTKPPRREGDLIIAIMSEVRRDKAEKKLPLNAPIKNLISLRWQTQVNAVIIKARKHRHRRNPKVENIKVLRGKAG